MMKNIVFLVFLIFALTASKGFPSGNTPAENKEKINVMLIVVDSLRADHLGCYGYYRDTSPNIDKLAKEGVLFRRTFSQGARTLLAVPSIVTSLYPAVIGIFKLKVPLSRKFLTLPEVLEQNGYEAALFAGDELGQVANFSYRFDKFKLYATPVSHEIRGRIPSQINKDILDWLGEKRSKPFFLFLHYDYPHAPYDPPKPYDNIFGKEVAVDKKTMEFIHSINLVDNIRYLDKFKDNKYLNYLISQYDGEIRYTDEQIKLLLEGLKSLNLSNNTLIIFTADHGDEFLEHGGLSHGLQLYDELTHVPLIMKLPGRIASGKRVADLTMHLDIMPTILDILNIRENNIMQGKSLVPLINNGIILDRAVFSETDNYPVHVKSLRTEKFKFVEYHHYVNDSYHYKMYNLETDPKELNNLVDKEPIEKEKLSAELRDYTLSCEKTRKSILGKERVSEAVALTEKEKERLKSLGYLK